MEKNQMTHDYSAVRAETPARWRVPPRNAGLGQIVRLHDERPIWSRHISNRLDELNNLEDGWDSYSASPVRFSTAKFVSEMLDALYFNALPIPSILPTHSGGLQVEWHRAGDSIEIAVERPNEASCYVCLEAEGIDDEFQARSDYALIREHLRQLLGS